MDRSPGAVSIAFPNHRTANHVLSTAGKRRRRAMESECPSGLPLLHESLAVDHPHTIEFHVSALEITCQPGRTRLIREFPSNRASVARMGAHARDRRHFGRAGDRLSMSQVFSADTRKHAQSRNVLPGNRSPESSPGMGTQRRRLEPGIGARRMRWEQPHPLRRSLPNRSSVRGHPVLASPRKNWLSLSLHGRRSTRVAAEATIPGAHTRPELHHVQQHLLQRRCSALRTPKGIIGVLN